MDLSRQLRRVLLDLRDKRLLEAFVAGKTGVQRELVFPSEVGTPLKPDNIAVRYMQPALEKAGLRHFRLHDLRHTFGSVLIQDGASLAYVKEQMGHSSITSGGGFDKSCFRMEFCWIPSANCRTRATAPCSMSWKE